MWSSQRDISHHILNGNLFFAVTWTVNTTVGIFSAQLSSWLRVTIVDLLIGSPYFYYIEGKSEMLSLKESWDITPRSS